MRQCVQRKSDVVRRHVLSLTFCMALAGENLESARVPREGSDRTDRASAKIDVICIGKRVKGVRPYCPRRKGPPGQVVGLEGASS